MEDHLIFIHWLKEEEEELFSYIDMTEVDMTEEQSKSVAFNRISQGDSGSSPDENLAIRP